MTEHFPQTYEHADSVYWVNPNGLFHSVVDWWWRSNEEYPCCNRRLISIHVDDDGDGRLSMMRNLLFRQQTHKTNEAQVNDAVADAVKTFRGIYTNECKATESPSKWRDDDGTAIDFPTWLKLTESLFAVGK